MKRSIFRPSALRSAFGVVFSTIAIYALFATPLLDMRAAAIDVKGDEKRSNSGKQELIEHSTLEVPVEMLSRLDRNNPNAGRVDAPAGVGFSSEVEPNGTSATASPIAGTQAVIKAPLFPNGDVDY